MAHNSEWEGFKDQSKNCEVVTANRHLAAACRNRGMVFSVQSIPMEYVLPLLSNNCTATEERCFLHGQC
jgi:hypothetical protein